METLINYVFGIVIGAFIGVPLGLKAYRYVRKLQEKDGARRRPKSR